MNSGQNLGFFDKTVDIYLILLLIFMTSCEAHNFTQIHGERYLGPVVSLVARVGQQQCVRECLARPALCGGVNYKRRDLLCEMVSSVDRTEVAADYVRIGLHETGAVNVQCSSCLSSEKCVTLSSKKMYCVKDDYDPKDCTAISDVSSAASSGLYRIRIPELGHVTVFCDMKTDGGGWTVFQRRVDGSVDFFRTWMEYKSGFGNLSGEFWLGNDKLHHLLTQGSYELRMDMSDFNNQTRFIKYDKITLGNEDSKYAIYLSGFSGDVGNCFTKRGQSINKMKFSTLDQDNDALEDGNCAQVYSSGWWHRDCHCSNPNGLYLSGNTALFTQGITYSPWLGEDYSLKYVQLMVRRVE